MPCTRHGETEAQSQSIYPTLSQNCSLPHVFPCLCEVRFSQQHAHSFSWVGKALVKYRGGHEILCAMRWAASFGEDCHFQGCCKGLPFFQGCCSSLQERCSVPLPPGMLQRAPPPPGLVVVMLTNWAAAFLSAKTSQCMENPSRKHWVGGCRGSGERGQGRWKRGKGRVCCCPVRSCLMQS